MGFNSNTTNRVPAITPIGTIFVFDISVLPAPVSDVITLLPGNYIISDTVDFGINSLKFDSVGEDLTIRTIDKKVSTITSATTAIFLDVVNARNVNLADLGITLSGAGATFFNVFGLTNTLTVNAVSVNYTGSGTKTVGTVDVGNFSAVGFVNTGWTNGITFQNVSAITIEGSFELSDFAGSGAFFNIINVIIAANFNSLGIVGSGVQDVFDISPSITAPSIIISRVLAQGATGFFKSGTTGAITLFANAQIAPTTIDSVTDSGGIARFNFTVGPTAFVGQEVQITGFITNTAYNQTANITVVGAGFFEISSIAFGSDEATGDFQSDSSTVTSTAHGQSEGQSLLITGTITYNGGYAIYNVQTNTFQINRIFQGAETTGTWDTGSLTQTDKRVDLKDCGGQQDSMNVAFGGMNANATATVIASADTYQPLDLNTVVVEPLTEGWILIDPTEGVFLYDGANPVSGALLASITCFKSGSTELYRFTDSINGVIPTFATAPYVPVEIKTTQINVNLIRPISVVPGDTVQIVGAGDGTSNNLTISDFFLQIII